MSEAMRFNKGERSVRQEISVHYSGPKQVVVGMSGGVDSAVTAYLLRESGYDVHGVFLCLSTAIEQTVGSRSCCSPDDAEDARRAAEQIGIPFHVVSAGDSIKPIIDYFVHDYEQGRTPNPCPLCNAQVKFAHLLRFADSIGAAYLATGHYARIRAHAGEWTICRAACRQKDQSYVLFTLDKALLQRLLLPLGEVSSKSEVRAIADIARLDMRAKLESQDICFAPHNGYAGLLERRGASGLRPGPIYSVDGHLLGEHQGIARYTTGQRRGLGIAHPEPLYVVSIDAPHNTLVVGHQERLRTDGIEAAEALWQQTVPQCFRASVQIRYASHAYDATIHLLGPGRFQAVFDTPVDCAVPGQAAVVYAEDMLLGGGWIETVHRSMDKKRNSNE